MVDTEIFVTNSYKSTIDLILTNKPSSFQKTMATESEMCDFHELASAFFKSYYSMLKLKIVYYRNYKNFKNPTFLKDLSNNTIFFDWDDPNEN